MRTGYGNGEVYSLADLAAGLRWRFEVLEALAQAVQDFVPPEHQHYLASTLAVAVQRFSDDLEEFHEVLAERLGDAYGAEVERLELVR